MLLICWSHDSLMPSITTWQEHDPGKETGYWLALLCCSLQAFSTTGMGMFINPLSDMVTIEHHIIVSFKIWYRKGLLELGSAGWNVSVRGSLGQIMSFEWWMSAEWAVMDKHPILPTSTNPWITKAVGTQGVKYDWRNANEVYLSVNSFSMLWD